MTITKLPRSPAINPRRNKGIDKYFRSKTAYPQTAFFEGRFKIKLANGSQKTEFGYSKQLNPTNNAEVREGQENAYLNALTKVAYRDGLLVQESEDVIEIDNDLVTDFELEDYFFYYPDFRGEKFVQHVRKRKDGSISVSNRLMINGKLSSGWGKETGDSEGKIRFQYEGREASLKDQREEAKLRERKLRAARSFK